MTILAAGSSTLAELLTAYVAIATAAGTAIWAVVKFVADHREARAHDTQMAEAQREERRQQELRTRQERAAELVKAVGEAKDEPGRRWTMTALSLYPDESINLLLNSLAQASDEDATAIKLALISIGPPAMAPTVRAHRIAGQLARTTEGAGEVSGRRHVDTVAAGRVRDCTREIVVQLLFQLTEEQRQTVDLAHVDLADVDLSQARLRGISFRKAILDRAVLTQASLGGVNLRGASLEGATLREARLRSADLTGARGAVRAIGAYLEGARLDHADLRNSDFRGAHLEFRANDDQRAVREIQGANLDGAMLEGALLGGRTMSRVRLNHVVGRKLKAPGLRADRLELYRAGLQDAVIEGGIFRDCRLVRVEGAGLKAARATFTTCHFGGAQLPRADLSGGRLTECQLGGANLAGARLDRAVLEQCAVSSAALTGATVTGTRFERCRFSGVVDFSGVDVSAATFADCEFADGARMVIDNDSWTRLADPATRSAFERSVPAAQPAAAAPMP